MLFNILDISYYFVKALKSYIYKNSCSNIRILIYHDIKTKKQIKLFKNQIFSLSKDYEFITPNEFENGFKNIKTKKDKLLLTFDDGFKSNRKLAEEVLNEFDIKAIFFIVSDFIGTEKQTLNYTKIINNIYPDGPKKNELSLPMDYDDISYLISKGHVIGCHTSSHKMLSKITSIEDLKNEIILSKDKLESNFNIKIKHFAFPFGTFDSINQLSIKLLDNNFDCIFTGFRGNNKKAAKLNYRDEVNPEMSLLRLKAFLIGNADFLYKRKFNILKSYLN